MERNKSRKTNGSGSIYFDEKRQRSTDIRHKNEDEMIVYFTLSTVWRKIG